MLPPNSLRTRNIFAVVAVVILATSLSLSSTEASTRDPIPVVVTLPVLKDLTEQVGGPHVRVTSLLSGYENEHTYSPKPTDLVAVRKARLLFEIGLGLEVWVSSLVKNAGGPSLHVITTSQGVGLIHDGGDDHHADSHMPHTENGPGGNPHIWLDPANVVIILNHITEALVATDPTHADEFRSNQANYLGRLRQLEKDLLIRTEQLSDRRFIAHHPAWPYLAKRFNLDIVGTIHTQAGIEPSALHLQSLIEKIRKEHIRVVVSEVQLSQRIPELLARETKAHIVILTTMPGGVAGTETYLDMLRYNVLQLAGALGTTS